MDGDRKPADSSSSHFPSGKEFNGQPSTSRPISSSSRGIFDSVFSPPPPFTVVGRDLSHSELIGSWTKQESTHHLHKTEHISTGNNTSQKTNGEGQSIPYKDRSSIFQEETIEPCSLSSSLYYGGPDICSNSPNTQVSGSPHPFKDGHENNSAQSNSDCASRGNWWQGSLYY